MCGSIVLYLDVNMICFVDFFSYLKHTGQTPVMLAEDDEEMTAFLRNYLFDIQNTGPNKLPWRFNGAWCINGEFKLYATKYVICSIDAIETKL